MSDTSIWGYAWYAGEWNRVAGNDIRTVRLSLLRRSLYSNHALCFLLEQLTEIDCVFFLSIPAQQSEYVGKRSGKKASRLRNEHARSRSFLNVSFDSIRVDQKAPRGGGKTTNETDQRIAENRMYSAAVRDTRRFSRRGPNLTHGISDRVGGEIVSDACESRRP